ncbi:succinate dehydrogenase cytochrome b subunit [Yimella sp. cx-51]|uniref:succinate dehydrogenase cytochrome b subunit n=1 Tax=Yimella sp. cx-51 TaxID=2770551 RepID=UPI00165D5CAE|nr:succinate dehydrogenase cytochrome b subunit [Yimella sp. cx-51]MBC9955480.1 succinate dehydrogenase cytochrome b subunit [Yimella sp. cx-51]QTH37934.1 succinate dehydrogenase cytochrome b subunit [Yimella sp. cx-51]
MAVTGLIFVAFAFVHMIGNLKVYLGAESLDHYAVWLRTVGQPLLPVEGVLWILRVVLLIALVAHIGCAVILWRRARVARGAHRAPLRRRTLLPSSMLLTGIALLAFIVFHLLDLTTGQAGPSNFRATTHTEAHAYANLIGSFERPVAALAYVIAMLALAAHVAHGVWTAVQDLGVTGRRSRAVAQLTGRAIALAVLLGNASIPIAVQIGALR